MIGAGSQLAFRLNGESGQEAPANPPPTAATVEIPEFPLP
jgi:hypothetical protein